jgi:dolichol kinase
MIQEIKYVILISGAVLVGLWLSNILYDLNVPHWISRKIGHAAGGLGFLLCVFLFSSGLWPLIITIAFTLMLWLARVVRPSTFRGVGGSGRATSAMAEVWFPLVAIPIIGIGWIWLNKPLLAIASLLFMAWGDCVTGLVRSQVYSSPTKGLQGSIAMFIVCLIIAWAFISPFWLGSIGAVVATVTEWACGDVGLLKWADDNWAIPLFSFIVMCGLYAIR